MERKLRESISYFIKSIQSEYFIDNILFLCISFEMLLGENVKENIGGHIRNVLLCLFDGDTEVSKKFSELYNSRSGAAHEGTTSRDVDISFCRYLYLRVLLKIYDKKIDLSKKTFNDFINNKIEKKLGFKPVIS